MDSLKLTPREIEILIAFVKEAKSDVDWAKVAEATNCKTSKYARDKFALIRNKIIAADGGKGNATNGATNAAAAGGDDESGETPKAKGAKGKASPRKRKDSDADDDESPTKKKKSTPRSKASASKSKKKASSDDDDDNEVEVKDEPN